MKQTKSTSAALRVAVAGFAAAAMFLPGVIAQPALADTADAAAVAAAASNQQSFIQYDVAQSPAINGGKGLTTLLGDFNTYWTPNKGVTSADGAKVLEHDDALTESINNAAYGTDGNTEQDQRALSDAQMNPTNTLYDALGPTLGKYYKADMEAGKLPKTEAFLQAMNKSVSTGDAKNTYAHPRPYVDRANYKGEQIDLKGLKSTLDVKKVPGYENFDWGDGETPDNEYDGLAESGSFPSGHTTFAFSQGVGLSAILPELGAQIMTRVSEAGNNRIVLGVHYPLDIMGGHIAGAYGVATALSDPATAQQAKDARAELQSVLGADCKANGITKDADLHDCINATNANGNSSKQQYGGYTNAFTDDVVTKPVTDRQSAIDAYTARMTYGFTQTGDTTKRPVVPAGAENLLANVDYFNTDDAAGDDPKLKFTTDELRQVIAASEIASGYPLDASSDGWGRINLAKIYTARVTFDGTDPTTRKITAISFGHHRDEVKIEKKSTTPTQPKADELSNLLKDYNNYFDFYQGGVIDNDKSGVLKHDDELTEQINNKAAADAKDATSPAKDQQDRAVSDAAMNSTDTLYDALGPVLGKYYKEGMNGCSYGEYNCKLSNVQGFLDWADYSASTSTAKKYFQHPRPYIGRKDYLGATLNLGDLKQTLNIEKVKAYEDQGQYDGLANSGSFPSGHTTFAFTQGTGLAYLLPELGPEIMTRVSEAGNNRIVLGVHYPLDILGGHIGGQWGVATMIANGSDDPNSEDYQTKYGTDARNDLVNYLTERCKADGYGDTLAACIAKTGANDKNGYKNAFTDDVTGSETVTDRKSAIDVYGKRMTYGFQQVGQAGQAPVVPDAAVSLLDNVEAFKSLTADQKKAVLAATEGDSGYPLDSTSEGWARLNLAAAYSAKVTLSADGTTVVKVEPGQPVASVVKESEPSTPDQPSEPSEPSTPDQPSKPEEKSVTVYRLYNNNSGLHHYTTSKGERDYLVKLGWSSEGTAFKAAAKDEANKNLKPVYREYNPNNGNHNWTMNKAEHDYLVKLGWHDEGIAWYTDTTAGTAVYRLYNPNSGEHLYTTNKVEYDKVGAAGWHQEGVAWQSL
ncbi:phosphatase PAP2 family protein [Bifidobacterium goeldii]|nr:phosphatase PAP2 family protein [Bifidobacterium goeldii]